jgi:hypothetical protein
MEPRAASLLAAVMLAVFWFSFGALAVGLGLWVGDEWRDPGAQLLMLGLLGLLLLPLLRVLHSMACAIAQRDWLLLGATLTVLAILSALTIRDAARSHLL